LGWLTLTATGGHPGENSKRAVVRRWIAPQDCTVTISGALEHTSESGDGVRGYIISTQGALGFWPVHHGKREMSIPKLEVKQGEAIDFVVDCNATVENDSFTWTPSIKALSPTGSASTLAWNAKEDFSGPKEIVQPLGPWEKYAQVLLMSNELAFID
ncbi:MAG TPA: hypothetical protein VK633_15285, partial [Verrucomicrobiae bacterium]|nr:hypothetical protein [Verrucomicrobiae bacterium]